MEREPRLPQDHGDIDVITLYAPRTLPDADFERRIAEWSSQDRAILVVLPGVLDDSSLDRLHVAGADLCVVTPRPKELVAHVARARGASPKDTQRSNDPGRSTRRVMARTSSYS